MHRFDPKKKKKMNTMPLREKATKTITTTKNKTISAGCKYNFKKLLLRDLEWETGGFRVIGVTGKDIHNFLGKDGLSNEMPWLSPPCAACHNNMMVCVGTGSSSHLHLLLKNEPRRDVIGYRTLQRPSAI